VAMWRRWGSPSLSLRASARSRGLVATQASDRRWPGLDGPCPTEVMAFDARGQEASPWALIDYGRQLAEASRLDAPWCSRRYSRSWAWSGVGPVPGTGKFRWRSHRRSVRLGGGARRGWAFEIACAVADMEDGVADHSAKDRHKIARGGQACVGCLLSLWDDDGRRGRRSNCWKDAGGRKAKAWDSRRSGKAEAKGVGRWGDAWDGEPGLEG
jgi:hypothetical protein